MRPARRAEAAAPGKMQLEGSDVTLPSAFLDTEFAPSGLEQITSGPRYRGGVDGLVHGVMPGWVVDLSRISQTLQVELLVAGDVVQRTTTGMRRPDLDAYLPDNRVGFVIALREMDTPTLRNLANHLRRQSPEPSLSLRADNGAVRIDIANAGVTDGECLAQVEAILGARSGIVKKAAAPAPRPRAPVDDFPPTFRRRIEEDRRRLRVAIALLSGSEIYPDNASSSAAADPRKMFSLALNKAIAEDRNITKITKDHINAIVDLFDPWFYTENHIANTEALINPLLHYVLVGCRDNNPPHPLFDPVFYRSQIDAFKGDPLLHFVHSGAAQGINPHPLFDVKFYREKYLDEQPSVNPLAHYLEVGAALGYDPSPLFSTVAFQLAAPASRLWPNALEAFLSTPDWFDVALVSGFDSKLYRYQIEVERGLRLAEPPLAHYLRAGFRDETLLPNLLFDPRVYREKNELELGNEPALLHYLREGDRAGLICHEFFDAGFYNRQRGDVGDGQTALEYALLHPEAPYRADRRMTAPIDPRLLQLATTLAANGGADFDVDFYRHANTDIGDLGDEDLTRHYRLYGKSEGRIGSAAELMANSHSRIRDLPLGFVLAEYTDLNPDLAYIEGNFYGSLCHYMLAGRDEGRLVGKWQFHVDDLDVEIPSDHAPLEIATPGPGAEVCVLIHAFYPELIPELVGFAQNFRGTSFDVFINLVDLTWTPEIHAQIRALCPGAFLQLSNDCGRDVGGFTRLLSNVEIDRYDYFAFFHSKKSPHIAPERGEYWRRTLLRAIAGSPEIADACIALFRANPNVGMIGAKEWRSTDMGKNGEQYERLLDMLKVEGRNRRLDYLSGFMFLARAEVVKRLYAALEPIDWEYGGDKEMEFHLDGQIAHGVERAFPALVRQMGYDVVYR